MTRHTYGDEVRSGDLTVEGNVSFAGGTDLSTALAAKADIAAAGKILQVQQAVKTTGFSTTSTSYVDITGLSVAITPAASDSKVLIFCMATVGVSDTDNTVPLTIARDSVNLHSGETFLSVYPGLAGRRGAATIVYLDSPATTSEVTYTARTFASASSRSSHVNQNNSGSTTYTATIIAMEVSA